MCDIDRDWIFWLESCQRVDDGEINMTATQAQVI